MKIGYFGSSFDPPTFAHLFVLNDLAERFGLDRVILGPCSNKRPDKKMKTSDEHRWNLLQLAVEPYPEFIVDDYEMNKEASEVFTYFTMEHYKQKYPNDQLFFMMGADLLVDIAKGEWDYGNELVANNEFIVTSRNDITIQDVVFDSDFLRPYAHKFHLFNKEVDMEISSTAIRSIFAQNRTPRGLLPDACISYIKENGLYK